MIENVAMPASDAEGDEVLQEAQRVPPADDRDVEIVLEQGAVGLDVDRAEDEEAPHGEEVRQPGDRPFQQPALAEHLGDLRPDPRADVVGATGDRLTGKREFGQPQHPADGEQSDDRCLRPSRQPV